MSGAEGAKIFHFPVDKRMPTRVAEEKLGHMLMYRCPDSVDDKVKWARQWIMKATVLYGWSAVKEGIVKSFKDGRVKHYVADVHLVEGDEGARPLVELFCGLHGVPVFNWVSKGAARDVPAVILSIDQSSYFRPCKTCEKLMTKGEDYG